MTKVQEMKMQFMNKLRFLNDKTIWNPLFIKRSYDKTPEERNIYGFSESELTEYRALDKKERRQFLKARIK